MVSQRKYVGVLLISGLLMAVLSMFIPEQVRDALLVLVVCGASFLLFRSNYWAAKHLTRQHDALAKEIKMFRLASEHEDHPPTIPANRVSGSDCVPIPSGGPVPGPGPASIQRLADEELRFQVLNELAYIRQKAQLWDAANGACGCGKAVK